MMGAHDDWWSAPCPNAALELRHGEWHFVWQDDELRLQAWGAEPASGPTAFGGAEAQDPSRLETWGRVRVQLSRSFRPAVSTAWDKVALAPAPGQHFVHLTLSIGAQKLSWSAACAEEHGRGLALLEVDGEACDFELLRRLLPILRHEGAELVQADGSTRVDDALFVALRRSNARQPVALFFLLLLLGALGVAYLFLLSPKTEESYKLVILAGSGAAALAAIALSAQALLGGTAWLSQRGVRVFEYRFLNLSWETLERVVFRRFGEHSVVELKFRHVARLPHSYSQLELSSRSIPLEKLSRLARCLQAQVAQEVGGTGQAPNQQEEASDDAETVPPSLSAFIEANAVRGQSRYPWRALLSLLWLVIPIPFALALPDALAQREAREVRFAKLEYELGRAVEAHDAKSTQSALSAIKEMDELSECSFAWLAADALVRVGEYGKVEPYCRTLNERDSEDNLVCNTPIGRELWAECQIVRNLAGNTRTNNTPAYSPWRRAVEHNRALSAAKQTPSDR